MSGPRALGHISPFFIVSDAPRAVRFYEERLGFEVRFSEPHEAPFFAIDGYVLFFGRPQVRRP